MIYERIQVYVIILCTTKSVWYLVLSIELSFLALTSCIYVLCTYMERCFLFLCNRCYEIEIMCQEFCFTINKVSVLKSSLLCPWQSYISCAWSLFSIHFWNNVYVRFINHVLWFFFVEQNFNLKLLYAKEIHLSIFCVQ